MKFKTEVLITYILFLLNFTQSRKMSPLHNVNKDLFSIKRGKKYWRLVSLSFVIDVSISGRYSKKQNLY